MSSLVRSLIKKSKLVWVVVIPQPLKPKKLSTAELVIDLKLHSTLKKKAIQVKT
ncbi:hypothetical protein D3C87_1334460 [compost metagenome]